MIVPPTDMEEGPTDRPIVQDGNELREEVYEHLVFLLVDSPISHDTCDKAIDFVVWPTGFEVFVI